LQTGIFFSFKMFAILVLFAAAALVVAQDKIGDFIFDAPKIDQKKGKLTLLPTFKAGNYMRIQWHTQPPALGNPPNISLEWRSGQWPNVSEWHTIARETPNNNYYDWLIPENMDTAQYIFRIGTVQKDPWIRNRTSEPFQIYVGRIPINGKIILDDSDGKSVKFPSILLNFAVVAVLSIIQGICL
jgi:hypothetical protein